MKELTKEQVEYAVGRLVRLVQFRDVKQTQLASLSDVNQSTISKILNSAQENSGENYQPSEDVLRKLFQALGLKLADILHESDHIANEILGYLATPLTGLSAKAEAEVRKVVEQVRLIAREESEREPNSPPFEIYWPGDHTHPTNNAEISASQVYVTDRSRASTHDFVVIFCGRQSYGVGQENEIATQAGVPAIRLVPSGLSRMMLGSFVRTRDITYLGDLDSQVSFDRGKLREALTEVRHLFFRHHALYRGLNGDAFGSRLRKLIDARSGDYEQFAEDLGISLGYLHKLMEEPFLVSNPSARLLGRMAWRLGESVAYLLGEAEESDPVWIESHASWRSWIEKMRGQGIEPAIALDMRDQWRHEYGVDRREQRSSASFRKPTYVMKASDWDKRYRQFLKISRKEQVSANQRNLL